MVLTLAVVLELVAVILALIAALGVPTGRVSTLALAVAFHAAAHMVGGL